MDHKRKRHNLELFARMGGPFLRAYFSLEIYGDELDPQELDRILGVSASKSYRKGDERPKGSQFYKTGGWLFESGKVTISEDRVGEEQFELWAAKLPGTAEIWSSLKAQFSVRVRLVFYTDQWNADFTVSPQTLLSLSSLGLPLMIDPYLSLDEPDA